MYGNLCEAELLIKDKMDSADPPESGSDLQPILDKIKEGIVFCFVQDHSLAIILREGHAVHAIYAGDELALNADDADRIKRAKKQFKQEQALKPAPKPAFSGGGRHFGGGRGGGGGRFGFRGGQSQMSVFSPPQPPFQQPAFAPQPAGSSMTGGPRHVFYSI